MQTREKKTVDLVVVGVGLATLTCYLLLCGPTFYWLDSSEFVAAAWGLGIAHPPGHPLAALLGRLLCMLPIGTLAFRVTLASALAAAAAAVIIALIAREILARLRALGEPERWTDKVGIATAGLITGLSYSLAFQAVRAEVYALNLLLLAACAYQLLVWDRTDDRRHLLVAAFVGGLALCNHHLLVLLAMPAFGLFVLLRRPKYRRSRRTRAAVAGVALCGALGLTTLAYLPLRARNAPQANWGNPTTLERFSWVVSARLFQRTVKRVSAHEPLADRATGALFALATGLGPVGALLGLGGLYLLWRQRESWRAGLLLSATIAGNLISPLLVGFDALNADAHGYLSVAVGFLAPAVAVFIVVVLQTLYERSATAGVAIAAACALLPARQAMVALPQADLRQHWAAEETGRELLALPPGSLLLTSYYKSLFNVWALRVTADHRPDIDTLHRNFLHQPGFIDDLGRKLPPTLVMLARAWRDRGGVDPADLDRQSHLRTVAVEYDLNIATELVEQLHPAGALLRFGSNRPPPGMHERLLARWTRALGPPPYDIETQRTSVWTDYLLAHFACRRASRPLAALHLQRALSLAPHDARLRELAANCRR